MTYDDLDSIFHLVHSIAVKARTDGPEEVAQRKGPPVEIVVSRGEDTYTLRRELDLAKKSALPKVATSVSFTYGDYFPTASIQRVEIRLGDFTRRVTIEGKDAVQVDLLAMAIRNKLDGHTTWLGGSVFRMALLAILVFCGLFFLDAHLTTSSGTRYSLTRLGLAVLGVTFLAAWALPWEVWLAGTAIYQGSASVLDRNANMISALGLVVPLAGWLLRVAWKRLTARAVPPDRKTPTRKNRGRN